MFETVKQAILANQYIMKLRTEFTIDTQEYDKLRESLRALVPLWQAETCVDKRLMYELYITPEVILYQALRPEYPPDVRDQLMAMHAEIDALILECLA